MRARIMPFVVIAAVALASFLIWRTLSRYSFDEIVASVTAIPASRLALAAGCAAMSYFCLSFFDTLALRYVRCPLPYPRIALASFTSLSLGHNIGLAALSSGAVRYRFYSRWGVGAADIAKVIVFCGVTVGLGLAALGGAALLLRTELAIKITGLERGAVWAVGAVCLLAPIGYLALAARLRRPWRIRGWTIEMPPLPIALGQLVVGPLNFAFVAGCLHHALAAGTDVPYLAIASAYVIANVTAIVSHVPGGLGVIETVLSFLLPGERLIGGLIAFRFIYFFVPLVIGATLFGTSEIVFRRRPRQQAPPAELRPSRRPA